MMSGRIGVWAARCAGAAALLALGGCGGGGTFMSGLYGSAATEPTSPQGAAVGPTAAAAIESGQGASIGALRMDFDPDKECPQIGVPSGTSAYAPGGGSTSGLISYQASLVTFARQCTLNPGNTVTIRIGVEGQVLLGMNGKPGSYSVPLRVAVVDRDEKVFYSKVWHVAASIPPGGDRTSFKVIDDGAVVPIGLEKPLHTYSIEVGFGGDTPAATPRKPRRR